MPNPLINQGTLNRIAAAVQVVNFPQLNVTTGFMTAEAVSISPEGPASDYLDNMTGATPSPRPYQMYSITVHMEKSQSLCGLWELQRQTSTSIGPVNVVPDSPVMPTYYFHNCVLMNVNELAFTGNTNDFPVVIRGTYNINAALYL